MIISSIASELREKLETTDLANMPGKVLYSGIATLCPGRIYMLGYNPGGDPAAEPESTKDNLLKLINARSDWSEYLDSSWRPGGRFCAPGAAPMQKRVSNLLRGISLPVREVCASNVIFVRSTLSENLANAAQLADRCWPVHQFVLEHVRPSAILSIGGSEVFDFIANRGRLLTIPEQVPSGHGNWTCRAAQIRLGNRVIALVSVPHLARYAVDHHPDVINWVRVKLGM